MKFKVIVTEPAEKNLFQIESSARLMILQKLKILETSPFPTIKSIRKIKASGRTSLFRLRIGNYRAIFHVSQAVVYVLAVIDRKDLDKAIQNLVQQ